MSLFSSRPVRVVGSTLAAAALPLLPTPAQAADKVDVPDGSTVVIDGRGYGHGRGMSQYGAQGAARDGVKHTKIVEFYYPGTSWGRVGGAVKVRITRNTSSTLTVRARSFLRVRDLKAGRTWMLPSNGAQQWRLTTDAKNRAVVQFKRKGKAPWKRWKAFGGEAQFAAAGRPITLVTPQGDVAYRGRLRAAAPAPGSRTRETVNLVSMENYLRGVVPLEIPASWHPEAVRAQAVAARTYATYERSHPLARHYQICDTTQCQVYGGASAEHPLADAAIKATKAKILTYKGKPAFTQFGSSNGGWAASGTMPYQVAKEDPYDGWDGNPVHQWQVKLTDTQIEKKWPALGRLTRITVNERNGHGDFGGRVVTLTLVGSKSKVRLSGDALRTALGLRSNWFDFSLDKKARKK
ncbi:SpoIID/LytB domain-containing protein [Nocardioides jishulii]|uniref:SpoIID/LytB domain-containing protein n=1 Tax=Nocardioides jishulii TaxID=2575440 RepID=A0A4U2YJQ5_9ACTN|nr:SpoIID/LytB domain-containing protein [Nocardioides jishulii]QCX28260.1 SpoIID/LytB domain-containing protein [Nocardioides jishulii]TKI60924.1 SpoIID/LytB domain-containing protein [Nocardioides jishulii]